MSEIVYEPIPSLVNFLVSQKFQNFAVGPIGSTKTTASIIKVAYEASRMAKARDGIRRSRCVIVRNTRQQLQDTTIPDFLKWFPDGEAGVYKKTEGKFILKFDDVECEVLFRGLDDSNDVRRLLSLQLSFAMLDEVREINPQVFDALTGRLGRYPDGMMVPHKREWGCDEKGNPIRGCVDDDGNPMKKLWGVTNPPDMDTFWHDKLSDPTPGVHVTIQPGAFDQDADWIHLLPSNYYEDLMEGKTEEWIDVYVHGKWGKSLAGKPVFRTFNRDMHVAKTELRAIKSVEHTLIIGMDFGLNPSAAICQLDMHGRLLVLDAISSDGMGLKQFIAGKLRPLLTVKYAGMPMLVIGDPAGVQRAQSDEKSCYDILKSEGFRAMPAKTNSIVARIAAVDTYLMRQIDGKSGILFDPIHASMLVKAMAGGYRYKLRKDGTAEDEPDKKSPYSHIADALQYACLHADGGLRGWMNDKAKRPVVVATAKGWT